MDRFPADTVNVNVWANALSQLVISKSPKKKSTKAERHKTLKQNNDILLNILRGIIAKCNQFKNQKEDLIKSDIYGH